MKEKKTVVETEIKQKPVEKKKEKKELTCGQCKFWDTTTTRDFHRDGIRQGLVECRSICTNPNAKSFHHLTMKESVKSCCVPGKFVAPVKEEKKTQVKEQHKEQPAEQKKQQQTEQKADKTSKVSVATNSLNGETKRLEMKGPHEKVFVKTIA